MAKDNLRTIADFLPLFASDPLSFEPGTGKLYSNGGYVVLGAIIEQISQQSYYDYVDKHIFRQLGMKQTGFYQASDIITNRASGYTHRVSDPGSSAPDNNLVNNIFMHSVRGTSAGGGYSTVDDLLKFALAIESNKLRIPEIESKTDHSAGNRGLNIGGGAPGVNAELNLNVAGAYTVIVLANLDPPSASNVAKRIRTLLE